MRAFFIPCLALFAACAAAPKADTFVASNCVHGTMKSDTATVTCDLRASTTAPRWVFVAMAPEQFDSTPESLASSRSTLDCSPDSVGDMLCIGVFGAASHYRLLRTRSGRSSGTVHARAMGVPRVTQFTMWISDPAPGDPHDPGTALDEAAALHYEATVISVGDQEQ